MKNLRSVLGTISHQTTITIGLMAAILSGSNGLTWYLAQRDRDMTGVIRRLDGVAEQLNTVLHEQERVKGEIITLGMHWTPTMMDAWGREAERKNPPWIAPDAIQVYRALKIENYMGWKGSPLE